MKNKGFHISGIVIVVTVISLLLVLSGCSTTSNTTTSNTTSATSMPFIPTTSTTSTTSTTQTAQISVDTTNKAGIGEYLVDAKGVTLYWTTGDAVGQSNITGAVLANWPVFYAANMVFPAALNASDFGSITRADGTMQTTFKGWPIYYYIKDASPGDTLGQGLGGVWFAVDPLASGPVALTTSTTTSTTTTTPTNTTSTTTTTSAGTPVTISLVAQGMAFNMSTITVTVGAGVTINFN